MKRLWAVPLAALVILAGASLGCGSGNHLVSIAVSPNPVDLTAPATLQLQAIGTYSDGTTRVLSSANWTFSSPSQFVNVSSSGLATCAVSGGPVSTAGKVTASAEGVWGTATVSCSSPGV